MGCVSSSSRPAKEPPEPVPDIAKLEATPIQLISGEPLLTNITPSDESLTYNIRQTGGGTNGNTFEVSVPVEPGEKDDVKLDDVLYKVFPSFGLGGNQVHRGLQDLVSITKGGSNKNNNKQGVLAFCIKDVPKGVNAFKILNSGPNHKSQAPTQFKGPNNLDLYNYASIYFDYDSRVGSIKVAGQPKDDPPLYTVRQCTQSVWVVKRQGIPMICITQVKGLMPKFASYQTVMSPGVEAVFAIALTYICDAFRVVNEKQMIRYWQ